MSIRHIAGITVVGLGPRAAGEPVAPGGLGAACAGSRGIVVDLAGCDLLDSALLGHMIHAHRAAQANGCRMCVCCPTELARETFDLTRLFRVLPVYDTLADALAAFDTPP
jgi:anti-anti-sigma regulatory factor